jgi:hypothetical protein
MKIIFLDVDGVLNSVQDRFSWTIESDMHLILLACIVRRTDAKIVVSSSWRNCSLLDTLKKRLNDFSMSIYGKTKDIGERGLEIKEWLDNHNDIESFVILDDEVFDIKEHFPNNFVQTSMKVGLQKEDVEKCIAILSNIKSK